MPSEDYAAYLPGLRYAESRGEARPYEAVGDAGLARGAYQVHPIMYKDIQQTFPSPWGAISYDEMLASPALQDAMAEAGLRMLGASRYKLTGDALLSAWNTGPTQARRGRLNRAYVATVRQGLARKGNPTMKRFK